MVHHRSCPMCITHTSVLTMGNSSQRPRWVVLPIRRWCTTIFTGLPKSMNQLWTTYLITRNSRLVSSMQLLMHPSYVNVRDMSWMLKSMSIHQKDSKIMVKYNFVISCLAFKGSIPTHRSFTWKIKSENVIDALL